MPTEAQQPIDLLEAGRKARLIDDRYRKAHELFMLSLESAWLQDDRKAGARALLSLADNLLWYSPSEIKNSELSSADELCVEALELFRQAGDDSGVADCLRELDRVEESLAVCRRIDDQAGIVRGLSRQAVLSAMATDCVAASEHALAAVELARTLDEPKLLADALKTAAICWREEGADFRRQLFLEAAHIYRQLNFVRDCATAMSCCALLACDDDPELQERLMEEAGDLWHSLERYGNEKSCVESLAQLAANRGDTSRAEQLGERAEHLDSLCEPD